ncbi:MAG: GyrI-like domain-containing protein [Rhodoluna sp.]|nr:GyrI-like domain-containing protein [Rhodoluna sp.]
MIQIRELEERLLLGMSRPFISAASSDSNGPQVIGPLWQEMSSKFFGMKLERSANPIGVGAMWRDEGFLETGAMIYFAGYEVDELPENHNGLEALTVAKGKFATVEHSGPMNELPEVITRFYTQQLPESGLERRVGMDLEIYYESENPNEFPRVVIAAPLQN